MGCQLVEDGGHASQAGICDGDEVVSLNGEPCSDLSLPEAIALIDASIDSLQLLVKRCCALTPKEFDSEKIFCGARDSSNKALESTTLHILPRARSRPTREHYIAESQDGTCCVEPESDKEVTGGTNEARTHLCVPTPQEFHFVGVGGDRVGPHGGRFSTGEMVELQLSVSRHTLEDPACTSLGSALGIEGEIQAREALQNKASLHTPYSLSIPSQVREPLGQHGVVVGSPSLSDEVEVPLQVAGRGSPWLVEGAGDCESAGEAPREEGGGQTQGAPASFTVTFGIPAEGVELSEERDSDSGSDLGRPNKHRAKHARLRRSESLSEKQVKEAKSKCKRIAILLNTDAPHPQNKGLLMFKKHRQRAKKFTLVSYGTGDTDPEYEDDDSQGEDVYGETGAIELNLVGATNESELDQDFVTNAQGGGKVVTFDRDPGLLEIERKLNSGEKMEQLPNTTGKGAMMFAQRRQRMDEIAAEHEEMRRQGIPVESVREVEKHEAYQQMEERSYMQATTESQAYMDVNVHLKQQQQYQQHQEQQYFEQQHYQQQQYEQQQYHQQQQQHYEQQQYHHQQQQYQQQQQQYQQHHQQQQFQQHQEYQQQQQIQQYSSNVNGMVNHRTCETQSSISNQTAQPFSSQNPVSDQFSYSTSGNNQDNMGQGEQIASRDERISTPAIKSGILQDTRNRSKGKPMFNFKQAPKVSPNPELLNLLNRGDKKLDCESGTEEDYLSLGAEACNFLQSTKVKHKIPPPVAPKPIINPNSPPWSPQPEPSNQELPPHAENRVPTPAAAPELVSAPAPELAPEPSPPLAPQEAPVPASPPLPDKHTQRSSGSQVQHPPQQETTWAGNGVAPQLDLKHEPQVGSWALQQELQQPPQQPTVSNWAPAEIKPQAPALSESPPRLPWVTPQPPSQPQTQPPMNSWAPAPAKSHQPWAQPQEQALQQPLQQWAQPQEQALQQPQQQWAQSQGQAPQQPQPPWAQPQEQVLQQPQPPWAQSREQALQQPQQQWAQSQGQAPQQVQPPQAQPQEQALQQAQPPWAQHQEQALQQAQPPWAQPQEQAPQQAQPPWAQPQEQASQQAQPPWVAQQTQPHSPQQAWPQDQSQAHPPAPWMSAPQPQPQMNAWTPQQSQAQQPQPPWVQSAQPQPAQPQPTTNAWGQATAQAPVQPPWTQNPQEQAQPTMNAWASDQSQVRPQPTWSQPPLTKSPMQQNWQQPPSQQAPQQPPMNAWATAQAQPQTHTSTWAQQPMQTPVNTQTPMNRVCQPSPKPWNASQSAPRSNPPTPPQRMSSYTFEERSSSPLINPMASVLTPAGCMGSALSMPAVRGKGADLFAKRQSRMEKYVVDSDTVQAATAAQQAQAATAQATKRLLAGDTLCPHPLPEHHR
ncbi:hypothetical protein UPYG_G00240340 [Umbra pygmaea]|uniref:PDZ domain-containing protein n=1 Tax=Umbra pygmaea TaxID=75934 RepID=A0ABD0WFZ5_UMBPY